MLLNSLIHHLLTFNVPYLIGDLLQLVILLILIEVVMSYMIQFGAKLSSYHPFVRFVRKIVNPMLDPVRRALPPYKTGNIDFSPLIVILVLQVIVRFLYSI
jgi:YggT family protein